RAFALLVGLDVEGDTLPLGQRLEPGAFDGGDVHEDVTASVVRLDEAVAALGIEEFDRTCHGHRETPFPRGCSAADPHGTAARPDIPKRGKQRPYGLRYSAGPPQEAERQSQPDKNKLIQGCGKVAKLLFADEPIDAVGPSPAPDRATASSGSRIASSPASIHGGLITIRPQAPSLVAARGAATPN